MSGGFASKTLEGTEANQGLAHALALRGLSFSATCRVQWILSAMLKCPTPCFGAEANTYGASTKARTPARRLRPEGRGRHDGSRGEGRQGRGGCSRCTCEWERVSTIRNLEWDLGMRLASYHQSGPRRSKNEGSDKATRQQDERCTNRTLYMVHRRKYIFRHI